MIFLSLGCGAPSFESEPFLSGGKSCMSTDHIQFSGPLNNRFIKCGLKPSRSLKMRPEVHIKFILGI